MAEDEKNLNAEAENIEEVNAEAKAAEEKVENVANEAAENAANEANAANAEEKAQDEGDVAEDGASEENTDDEDPKLLIFKKKIDKKDEEIKELNDKVMRQLAEFDNFRKRTEKEKSDMFDTGATNVIEKILPVVDSFERAMKTVDEEDKDDEFVKGMTQVYKQLMQCLTDAGVEAIEAEGKEFDPNLHNAVMHGEDENLGENIIAEEFQKGYKFHDKVIRYSMVRVVN
ncbi:MAG: nucleotide exchange factor GrpE [Lachnospiraceae bacterium]|nr:nucleotide exchange factor GrpE [Lachnospiraceae bacterium]